MTQQVLLSSVLYPTKNFNSFLHTLFTSIKCQKYKTFSILLFLDGFDNSQILPTIKASKLEQEIILHKCQLGEFTPSQIRQKIIDFAYEHNFNVLIFYDFDEKMSSDRIKQTLLFMNNNHVDFTYCNAYITDSNFIFNKKHSFFHSKNIPATLNKLEYILRRNFVGMGGLALKLNKDSLYNLNIPNHIQVFDWFLATYMLLNQWHGKKINKCLVYYRQHDENHIGTNTKMDHKKLHLGIQVKKNHYLHFLTFHEIFKELYEDIVLLEKYIIKNEEKYIRIINENFSTESMCWWENIKSLKEIEQWI